jgi:hypothetical protein
MSTSRAVCFSLHYNAPASLLLLLLLLLLLCLILSVHAFWFDAIACKALEPHARTPSSTTWATSELLALAVVVVVVVPSLLLLPLAVVTGAFFRPTCAAGTGSLHARAPRAWGTLEPWHAHSRTRSSLLLLLLLLLSSRCCSCSCCSCCTCCTCSCSCCSCTGCRCTCCCSCCRPPRPHLPTH